MRMSMSWARRPAERACRQEAHTVGQLVSGEEYTDGSRVHALAESLAISNSACIAKEPARRFVAIGS